MWSLNITNKQWEDMGKYDYIKNVITQFENKRTTCLECIYSKTGIQKSTQRLRLKIIYFN